ncbi:MAG: hypothetical protein M0R32_05725 [Candidatus Cloacimonetes bacterium]|jgi:hypothetical protein|nr:hypothetical protein [Candidatus Cloacimonadota bacterium]
MKKSTHIYVEFQAPGILFAEMWTEDINSTDPNDIKWPDNAYAFRIYKREDIEDNGNIYKGTASQVGPTYYHPDSKVETLAQLEARNDPKNKILVSNMKGNKWNEVVWSRWGSFPQPYDSKHNCILKAGKTLKQLARETMLKNIKVRR